jgi:hypothetical protein
VKLAHDEFGNRSGSSVERVSGAGRGVAIVEPFVFVFKSGGLGFALRVMARRRREAEAAEAQ